MWPSPAATPGRCTARRLTVDLPREEEGPAGVGVLIGAACGGGGVLIGIQQRTLLIGEGGGKRGQGVVRLRGGGGSSPCPERGTARPPGR